MRSCDTCVFGVPNLMTKNSVHGQAASLLCKFNPPTAHPIPIQSGQGITVQVVNIWPGVYAGDFCSRWLNSQLAM